MTPTTIATIATPATICTVTRRATPVEAEALVQHTNPLTRSRTLRVHFLWRFHLPARMRPKNTSSIHNILNSQRDDREGEHGQDHAPPARPQAWGRHGFDAHQDGQDNCQNTPRSRRGRPPRPSVRPGRAPPPRRSLVFLPVADPGPFVSRPIPLRGLIGRETKGPGLLGWGETPERGIAGRA